ncbi:MAG: capsid cement protein [Methylocella sp.]
MALDTPMISDGCQTVAGADLRTKQYYPVKLTAARTVGLATTGGENIYGILQNKPNTGDVADVCIFGICKAIAGGTVTAGGAVMSEVTNGRIVDQTSTNAKIGVALEGATAANQIISIKVIPTPG